MMIVRCVAHGRREPDPVLQQRGDDVAVREHRALGHAGGAAGVLQEGDVGVARAAACVSVLPLPASSTSLKRDRARQLVGRHHLLHLAHHQVHEQALQAEHLAERGDDDVLQRRLRAHLLQHVAEVLEDHDRLGARVLQLVLELARRVERVDVHHRAAGAQRAEHRDRVLQAVRHHDRDARALGEPLRLQPGAEGARLLVELGVADGLAHVGEGGAVGVLADAHLEQLDQRLVFAGIDVGRHAGGIALQPDAVHVSSSYRGFLFILLTSGAARHPAPMAA